MSEPPATPEPSTPKPRYSSTADVAAALGVSVTTVKRWVDGNVLPAHRTPGGHRKVLTADVLRLVRESHFPRADLARLVGPEVPAPPDHAALLAALLAAITAADAERVRELIVGGYRGGLSVEELADRVICPGFRHVGHEWESGRLPVMTEHRLSQAAAAAVYELRGMLRTAGGCPERPVAVGGAPEHDHYMLPTLLAQLTLLDGGWDAVNLGPHTPVNAFRAAVEDLRPLLVWVSVSHLPEPEQFAAEFNSLCEFCEATGVAVAVGGRGLTAEVRAKLRYTAFGDGLTQLLAFARSLHRRHACPKRKRG